MARPWGAGTHMETCDQTASTMLLNCYSQRTHTHHLAKQSTLLQLRDPNARTATLNLAARVSFTQQPRTKQTNVENQEYRLGLREDT